jgi:hypothetical protein
MNTTNNNITNTNYDSNMKIFPTENEVPEKFRIQPIEQKKYLVNGELRTWDGSSTEVYTHKILSRKWAYRCMDRNIW